MMTKLLAALAVVLVLVLPVSASARSIPGAPNEVDDPWFILYVDNQMPTWYVSGGDGFTPHTGGTVLPGYYYDAGRNPGDTGFLRTIVDDTKGLWNPAYKTKEIDLFFYAHVSGSGYINVRFDWWDDPGIPKPSNDPNDPGTLPPDGYTDWYTITADDPGPFREAWDLVAPGEVPNWWTPYSFHDIWDHQPRWVSIEFDMGAGMAPTGGESLITGIDFEARCIPEPGTLTLLALGALALIRRRK
jgi:hypothetical protein